MILYSSLTLVVLTIVDNIYFLPHSANNSVWNDKLHIRERLPLWGVCSLLCNLWIHEDLDQWQVYLLFHICMYIFKQPNLSHSLSYQRRLGGGTSLGETDDQDIRQIEVPSVHLYVRFTSYNPVQVDRLVGFSHKLLWFFTRRSCFLFHVTSGLG